MTMDLIDQYEGGYRQSQVMMTAVRLGLFDAVEKGVRLVPALAAAMETDERATRILCDALVGMELLVRDGDEYQNTAPTREQLLRDVPGSRVDMVLHGAGLYATWGELYDVVKTGKPTDKDKLDARLKGDPVAFARAMAVIGRRSAGATVDLLDLEGVASVLDVGGGPGMYAMAFAQHLPAAEVTLFDSSATLEEASRNIEAAGLSERIRLMPGDMFDDPVGEGYDLVLVSNVLHIFSPERNQELVSKLGQALAPNGRLCVKEFVINPERTGPAGALMFGVNMLVNTDGGHAYSLTEIQSWLAGAGLAFEDLIDMTPQSSLVIGRKN